MLSRAARETVVVARSPLLFSLLLRLLRTSFRVVPDKYEMNAGSIGKMHGEKNEPAPASADIRTLVSTIAIFQFKIKMPQSALILYSRSHPNPSGLINLQAGSNNNYGLFSSVLALVFRSSSILVSFSSQSHDWRKARCSPCRIQPCNQAE
jgi:hypothetical protein